MLNRMAGRGPDEGPSLSALLAILVEQLAALVRGEIRLARAEAAAKIRQAFRAGLAVLIALLVFYAGFLVLLAACVMGLAKLLPDGWGEPWVAAFIVSGIVLLVGFAMVAKARSDLSLRALTLKRTADSLDADADLVKDRFKGAR
jgi:hypothetical protein